MIFGVLGKGGSGKSTVAAALVRALHGAGNTTLAIDADHNIDLAYLLGVDVLPRALPYALDHMRERAGGGAGYAEPVMNNETHVFSLKGDPVLDGYATEVTPGLLVMVSGEQNERVLYGATCSHSLASPLKMYLPLLHLTENEAVVVDEKASADAVSTGIPTGFDLALVVAHNAPQSTRAAKGIIQLLEWYGVPYVLIANSVETPSDSEAIEQAVGVPVFTSVPFAREPRIEAHIFLAHARSVSTPNTTRLTRSKEKFRAQQEYKESHLH